MRAVLQTLQDRKNTLKDFTGTIDYSVYHPQTDSASGKRGTVDYRMDAERGPVFSADFTVNTDDDGKPKMAYHTQFVFDGQYFLVKDFGRNNDVKQYIKRDMLPAGAKPGDAVSLNGTLALPIGVSVDEVVRDFDVTAAPSKDANLKVLKLVPRTRGKFDFSSLEVTVDMRPEMQIPIKVTQTATNRDVTTIALKDVQINTGKAKPADTAVPANEGWTERK